MPRALQFRSGPRHFFRLTLIEALIKNSLKKGVLLDAGCGDGSLSMRLAGRGFHIYAVDSSQEWCDIFKARLRNSNLEERIKIFCSPLLKGNFERGFFDCIICGEVLEHIDDDLETLKNFYLLLKRGGILILSVPLKNKGLDSWDRIAGHLRLYDYGRLKRMLVSVGFSVEKTLCWGYPFTKLYHRSIFLKWASKIKNEAEIIKPGRFITALGKSYLVSVILGAVFLIDILFTPRDKAIGIILKAKKP